MPKVRYSVNKGSGGLLGRADKIGVISRGGAPVLRNVRTGTGGGGSDRHLLTESGFIIYTESGEPIQYD